MSDTTFCKRQMIVIKQYLPLTLGSDWHRHTEKNVTSKYFSKYVLPEIRNILHGNPCEFYFRHRLFLHMLYFLPLFHGFAYKIPKFEKISRPTLNWEKSGNGGIRIFYGVKSLKINFATTHWQLQNLFNFNNSDPKKLSN